MMRATVFRGGRFRRDKGLPVLLEGRVSPSADRADRFLQFIGKLRCQLLESWTCSRKSKGKSRAVQAAVDELISLALLTEFIRQRDDSLLPALKDVVEHLHRPSVRRLCAAIQEAVSDPLLKSVFASGQRPSSFIIPKMVAPKSWLDELAEASRQAYGSLIPISVFGGFHLLCMDRPVACADGTQARAQPVGNKRHRNGIYYTPAPLVDYLVYCTLSEAFGQRGPDEVARLRILDPACGCGAFLIAILRYIMASSAHERAIRAGLGACRNNRGTSIVAKRVLQERLDLLGTMMFGMDTDAQAVEWTIRSLLLTVWEACLEDGISVGSSHGLRIPDLRQNIIPADFLGSKTRDDKGQTARTGQGADVILGAPPFVRLEQLHKAHAGRVAHYRRRFKSARSGQFDLYMLFVERSLELLAKGGLLGFSVSGSFLRGNSGRALRRLIAERCRTIDIIEFEDRRVYPDSRAHICLLSARKVDPRTRSRHALVKGEGNLRFKLGRLCSRKAGSSDSLEIRDLPSDSCASGSWRFESAREAELLSRMETAGTPLEELPVNIYLGVSTGADDVFILRPTSRARSGKIQVEQRGSREKFLLEAAVVRPILRGRHVSGFAKPVPASVCLFPYDRHGRILDERVLRTKYPLAYSYLAASRPLLHKRRMGPNQPWYALRKLDLSKTAGTRKLVASAISPRSGFTIDTGGKLLCHQSVIILCPIGDHIDPFFLLGILNSEIVWTFIRHRMPVVRADRYACRVGAFRRLPVPLPQTGDRARICEKLGSLAKQILMDDLCASSRGRLQARLDRLVCRLYGLNIPVPWARTA